MFNREYIFKRSIFYIIAMLVYQRVELGFWSWDLLSRCVMASLDCKVRKVGGVTFHIERTYIYMHIYIYGTPINGLRNGKIDGYSDGHTLRTTFFFPK